MPTPHQKPQKSLEKASLYAQIRQKLGITQDQLSKVLHVSRPYLAMVESGKRNVQSAPYIMLVNMYQHFHELETGKQSAERSIETRLFLNNEYQKQLPEMKRLEKDCRTRIKAMKEDLQAMKDRARDAEHAIIVFTKVIDDLEQPAENKLAEKEQLQIAAFKLFKEQAYNHLLTCWEPEQAKLHAKIEAIAGEARALRRYRVKVMRDHHPIKDERRKADLTGF